MLLLLLNGVLICFCVDSRSEAEASSPCICYTDYNESHLLLTKTRLLLAKPRPLTVVVAGYISLAEERNYGL